GRGVLTLEVEIKSDRVQRVKVDMGEPILPSAKVPAIVPGVTADQAVVNQPFVVATVASEHVRPSLAEAGVEDLVTCISMGNPHAVLYARTVRAVPLEQIGPILETHEMF